MAIAAQLPCPSCALAARQSPRSKQQQRSLLLVSRSNGGIHKRSREMQLNKSRQLAVLHKPGDAAALYNGLVRLSVAGMLSLLGLFPEIALAEESSPGYSIASYYTSLGLFVLALPGLWSLIKRSAKSKIVRKTYMVPGPSDAKGKSPKQIAGEISSFFTRNNFNIVDTGEVVKFEGFMVPSRGQAAFLTFCTLLSLASVALVLTITVPAVGDRWYWLTGLSPLAGAYYWTRASRKEQIQVKLVIADDNSSTDVIVQGDDEQINLLSQELGLMEKGMVYVKGILQR